MARRGGKKKRRETTPSALPLEASEAPFPARDPDAVAPLLPLTFWAAGGLAFFLAVAGAAPLVAAFLLAAPFAVLALVAPLWARRSIRRFDVDQVKLLSRGATHALLPRLRRAWGMRLFASRDLLAEREGRVALESGQHRRARRAFAVALSSWHDEDRAPLSVRLGYAHACYALGDHAEARWVYSRLLEQVGALPRVATSYAHALHLGGAEAAEIANALSRAERSCPDDEERVVLALLRAHLAAAAQQRSKARAALSSLSFRSARAPKSARIDALTVSLRERLGLAPTPHGRVVSLDAHRGSPRPA